MTTVADGIKAQLSNIEKTYGHSIDDLIAAIAASGLTKHTDVVAMLKQRYGMTHGAAHRVSLAGRDRLESAERWNALFTHRVRVKSLSEVDSQLRSWLAAAYNAAG